MKQRSNILKLALFATGLSGIVAEYILATLASYFLGDSVFQWTMIVSVMMFSMGLGSRFSKYFNKKLLQKFIFIEFLLSVLVSLASVFTYTAASYTIYTGFIIYTLGIIIGVLIGMEIPLVVRLNQEFESLRINVAAVIEKDYYGSLAGGLFFAFVGLPYLGLTYTPFVLGGINFLVALLLLKMLYRELPLAQKKLLFSASTFVGILILAGFFLAEPIVLFGEQKRYQDKIIYSRQSRYQRIVITQWNENYWLYINGNQQLSTIDEAMYHEPLVHPAAHLSGYVSNVLILGGGDGCAVRELLKYPKIKTITLIDLDPVMTNLGQTHPVLTALNQDALNDPKVSIRNKDAYLFLEETAGFYDLIIVDLPDPKTVELSRMYSLEFYSLCRKHLRYGGVVVTQAGSPYFATKAFRCIEKTMRQAGMNTLMLHNQIVTLGEWGWVLAVKDRPDIDLKQKIRKYTPAINTRWLNHDAMLLMSSFGKDIFSTPNDSIEVNTIHKPVLFRYYTRGNWDLY